MSEVIAFGADHGGYQLKDQLMAEAEKLGYQTLDLGTNTADSVDYPEFGQAVAKAILEGKAQRGVVVCGSGIGISIAANRFNGIRAALCHDETTARLCREHNNANILALGERTTGPAIALECLKVFLETPFEGGRHERRVGKLDVE